MATVSGNMTITINDNALEQILKIALLCGAIYVGYKLFSTPKREQITFPKDVKEIAKTIENASTINDIIGSERVKRMVAPLLMKEEYLAAVREGCVVFMDIIRDKSGVKEDGIKLINTVFDKDKPVLKFVNLNIGYMNNIDDNVIGTFKNIVSVFRNQVMHCSFAISKQKAFQEISMISYCAEIIENNTELVY